MTPKSKHILVGLFVVFLSGGTIAFLLWLGGSKISRETDTYLLYITESVSGLPDNAPVKYKGVTIGRVEVIRIDPINSDQVELQVQIERGSPIKEDSNAILTSRGITGIQYIEISGGSQTSPYLTVSNGKKYPVIPVLKSTLSAAQESVGPILQNINLAIGDIRDLLKGTEHLTYILKDIRLITDSMAQQPDSIPNLFKEIQTLSTELNSVARQIQKMVQTSDRFLTKREEKVDNLLIEARLLLTNLNRLTTQVEDHQLVQGINHTILSTDKLVTNLDSQLADVNLATTMEEMETTLKDIQDLAQNLTNLADDLRNRASPLILSRPEQGVQP